MIAVSVAASRGALGQPPAEPHPEWQLGAALEGRKYFLDYSSSPSTDGTQEDGLIEVTKFYQPLLDDGAPYSLAPYLQRASLWFVRS